ncbi:MAG: hydroxyacid dehydrogenase [bacterium]
MQQYKILISDRVADVCSAHLSDRGFKVDTSSGLTSEDLCAMIGDYHGLIVRSASKVTADVVHAARNLRVIGRAGVGVDNIDVAAATKRGIAVLNAADGNTISAAEFAFGLMIALARQIPASHISMQNGKWERQAFRGVELYGKVLGVIGLGKIGREVASRAQAFGMQVLAYDPLIGFEVFRAAEVKQVDLNELFTNSDFVTVHVPLADATRNLISTEQLQNCKPGLRLINAARGGVVDEQALYDAIKSGNVAGAALDVYAKEPPGENALIGLENVITTPHLGASTFEAQLKVAKQIANLVADFLLDGIAENIVNPESQ